jgi:hypothetical protein
MKTQLKVIALSVLVATSVHAKESEDMYFGLGAVQTKFGGEGSLTEDGITSSGVVAAIAASKAAPLAADFDNMPTSSLE